MLQGVELQRSASMSALPSTKSMPSVRRLERSQSDKKIATPVEAKAAPQPTTLRELLLSLAGVSCFTVLVLDYIASPSCL